MTKEILRLVPLVQSIDLLGENIKLAKKKDKDVEDFAKAGVKNIMGAEFIKLESDMIEGF